MTHESTRPDGDVADLERRIQSRLGSQLREFQLHSRKDGLVLRGQARSYYAKQLAQQAVMETTDRPILANEIEVP